MDKVGCPAGRVSSGWGMVLLLRAKSVRMKGKEEGMKLETSKILASRGLRRLG